MMLLDLIFGLMLGITGGIGIGIIFWYVILPSVGIEWWGEQ